MLRNRVIQPKRFPQIEKLGRFTILSTNDKSKLVGQIIGMKIDFTPVG